MLENGLGLFVIVILKLKKGALLPPPPHEKIKCCLPLDSSLVKVITSVGISIGACNLISVPDWMADL